MTGCATRPVRVTRGCPPAGGWCPPPTLGDNGDGDTPCRANFRHWDPAPGGHHGLGAFWGQGSCCAHRARSGHGDLRGWGLFRHKAPPPTVEMGSPHSGCCKDTGTPLILSTHSIRARGSQQGRGYRVRGGSQCHAGGAHTRRDKCQGPPRHTLTPRYLQVAGAVPGCPPAPRTPRSCPSSVRPHPCRDTPVAPPPAPPYLPVVAGAQGQEAGHQRSPPANQGGKAPAQPGHGAPTRGSPRMGRGGGHFLGMGNLGGGSAAKSSRALRSQQAAVPGRCPGGAPAVGHGAVRW